MGEILRVAVKGRVDSTHTLRGHHPGRPPLAPVLWTAVPPVDSTHGSPALWYVPLRAAATRHRGEPSPATRGRRCRGSGRHEDQRAVVAAEPERVGDR